MKKALLLSIKPRFAEAIFEGTKVFELRKVRPRLACGDLVLVYVTSPRCQLEGAFDVVSVIELPLEELWKVVENGCALTKGEFDDYFNGKTVGYAIGVGNAWVLETSRNLRFLRDEEIVPPQSYRYLSASQAATLLGG
ncbi:MAG: ASCH domain-containing protein [Luteolibacter sp.]